MSVKASTSLAVERMTEWAPCIDTPISPSMIYSPSFPFSTRSCRRKVNALAKWSEVVMTTHVSIGTLNNVQSTLKLAGFADILSPVATHGHMS